jgi:hypothetical protein
VLGGLKTLVDHMQAQVYYSVYYYFTSTKVQILTHEEPQAPFEPHAVAGAQFTTNLLVQKYKY